MRWTVHGERYVHQSDWISAVQSAMDSGITTDWGKAVAVVTDQMILSWVQSTLSPPAP